MKAGIFSAGKLGGIFVLAFILAGCRHPATSQPAPDATLKRMDAESAGGRRRHGGRRRKKANKDPGAAEAAAQRRAVAPHLTAR